MKTQAEERTREPVKINEELQREIEDRKRAEKALREETMRHLKSLGIR
jgi:C4-dicarboxylate-specific signal transduction histidine kinase